MSFSADRYPVSALSRRWIVRPRYILGAAGLLAVLVFGSSFYEQTRDREDILRMMRYQAASLAQAVGQSAENVVYAGEEIEDEVMRRLEGSARLVDRLDATGALSEADLREIAAQVGAVSIGLYTGNGMPAMSSDPNDRGVSRAFMDRLLTGEDDVLTSGFRSGDPGRDGYAVGVRRIGEGAVLVRADVGKMLGVRRRVGVGRLIQDIGAKAGVAYVVLQDGAGILAASRRVSRISSIQADPFLRRALDEGMEDSRMTPFEGEEIFEAVQPFILEGTPYGLLRIGLRLEGLHAAETRGRTRLIWMSGGLLIAGIVLFNFLLLRQNYDLVNRAYRQIRTYTGDVLEHMADGVVVVDREGRITTFNRAAERIFGYPAGDVLGRSCREIVTDQTPVLEKTLQSGEGVMDVECGYRTRKGKALVLSIGTSILRDEAGVIEACIAVVKDLTEQKKMEEEARRRERLAAMGELAAGVAHEIRNPLNAVGMIVQRFEDEFTPVEDRGEYTELVRIVESEIDRVNGIVEQFLAFARPPKLAPRPTDVDAMLQEMGTVIAGKLARKGVRMTMHPGLKGPVAVDREQLAQAVLNLFINAVEATPGGGKIDVSTCYVPEIESRAGENTTKWIELAVADTGTGMDAETMDRIFDPYFTTRDEGTGLGLSLVARIVDEHGGRIEVQSQQGKGTVFRILLPETYNGDGDHSDRR